VEGDNGWVRQRNIGFLGGTNRGCVAEQGVFNWGVGTCQYQFHKYGKDPSGNKAGCAYYFTTSIIIEIDNDENLLYDKAIKLKSDFESE
jgi:hypothetical protein